MNNTTRILIVEDNLPDFELAQREISRSLKNCEFKRVQTRREYVKALASFQPDLILSDYNLPGFNGMKALQIAREHTPLTPLIIWTGTTREDIAVDCMKAGANNYVLKENIKRLGPAILHALEERHLLIERRQAEERTRAVLENSPIGIFQSTPEGRFVSANTAMARIHGYASSQEMIDTVTDIARQMYPHPEKREEFKKLFETRDVVESFERTSLRKDGSIIWTSTSARVVRDDSGRTLYYEGFLQDITERKNAEEALRLNEKRFRSLLVHGLDSISLLAADGTLIWESPAVVRILDYPHDFFVGHNIFEIVHPDDLAWTRDMYVRLLREPGRREHQSFRLRHSDGSWRWVEAVVTNMLDEPGVNAVVVNYRDITQRRQAEEKLQESEERYRLLFENNPLPMWIYDLETLAFLKVNDAAVEHYGYSVDEFMAMTIKDIRPPEDIPALLKLLDNAQQGISRADTWRHCKKDGTVIFVDIVSHNVEFKGRRAELVLANDITERRQAELELQQRNDDLGVINAINEAVIRGDSLDLIMDLLAREIKRLFAGKSSTIYMFDADGRTLTMPRYYLHSEILSKIEKLIGRPIPSIHIPVREGGYFQQVLSSGRGTITSDPSEIQEWMAEFVETTFLPAMGKSAIRNLIPQIFKLLNIKSAIAVPLISDGKTIGVLDTSSSGIFTEEDLKRVGNIALQLTVAIQRQQVQEKLRESENRLILALSAAQMSVWEWNLQTNDVIWSPEFYAITGIAETTFDGTFEGYTDLIHPQDAERVRSAAQKAVAADAMFAEEFRIIRPDGEIRWLANLGHAEYGHSGNHLRMIGTIQDITQRKQVEIERQALLAIMQGFARTQDLREFLELIHRSIGNVIYAENFFVVFHDKETGLFEEIYSVDKYDPPAPPSSLEKSITSYVFRTGEPLLLTQTRFDELLEQGEVELVGTNSASWLGLPLKTAAGTIGVIAVQDYENSNRYSERDRNFLASIASQVALAIERKQAEEEMRRSEERYRALFENSPVSIWEEDFSQVKNYLDSLKRQGDTDVRAYFTSHPEKLNECARLICVLDVNHAGLQMYKAQSKAELIESTLQMLSTGEQSQNLEDFVAIAEGRISNTWEGTDQTLTGEPLEISLKWSVAPGYERDFSKVIVTVFDITDLKRAEEAEHEQRTLAEALRDTAEILTSTLDYGEVLDHILSAVGRVLPHDAATIMLIDGEYARVVRSQGYEDRQLVDGILGIKLRVAETTNLRQITETGQTIIVHDTHSYPGWHRMQITDWLHSNVGAPILIQGKVIGFILLDSKTVGFFTPVHAERLEAFANQAALAINNANILQQAQEEIAERKRAEEKLRASEERFRQMADNIEEVFWMTNAQTGEELYMSPASEKVWGHPSEYLIQNPNAFTNSILPEDRPVVLRGLERERAGEKVEMEYRITRPDGSVRWIWDRAFPVFDENGQVKSLAGIAADVTERKLAEEEISRRAEETSALLATSMALTNLDLNAILNSVGNSAKTLFMADGCRIFLMQPDGESLRCVLALQENAIAFSDLRVRLGEGVTGAVAASGQAEIVNTMQIDPRAVQVPGTQDEEEAIMFAPLKERDRTIGVLSVRRAGTGRPFQPEDLEFLEAFASMAATAVSNARLFEETQRRLAELEALYENGLAVGQLLEPRHIGERIIETFARHLSWHHVAIRLLRQGTEELELIAFNQPDLSEEERSQAVRHFNSKINKIGQGLSGWVVQIGQPIRSGNVYDYPQYIPTYPGILSGLYMPLKIGERVIGVISVESEEAEALTAQDERLLATLANQAAIAFENARLYQAAQQEISERKRVEKELRESQERYQLLVETSPDGVILLGMDGTIRFSNGQMAGLFHVDHPAELVGTSITSLFAPEERQHIEQSMGNPIFSDTPQEGHWLIRKDGSRFFGELRSSALKNETGEQYAIIAQLRDVTERKQSQEALQEERQRFLDLFENSPNPTWLEDFTAVVAWMNELRTHGVQDLQKYIESNPGEYREAVGLIRILNVNQAAVITNGARNKKELIDRVHEMMLDEAPSDVMIHELDMIWQGHTSFGFEMTSRRLNGSLITGIQRIYIPINNDQPDYARVIVTSTDITDRVEMESKLRASELHYRELADSITDVLFELDHELRYTHWNKASEMLMGIPANDAIGRSMYEVFGESQEQLRIGRIYQNVLEDNKPRTFETEILLQGQKLVFEINANPSTRGVSVVARNITDRKLTETLLQKRFELMDYALRHSLSEVMQKTIDMASELTGSHIGFMNFIENEKLTVNLQAFSTETISQHHNPEARGMHNPVEMAGVWADAIRQRQTIIHNDYETLENKNGLPGGHLNLIREMLIPIIRNDVVVAVMGVGNKAQEYTQQDIETAERFADYAWDITERKQMENALAEEHNQLAKRVEERTADLSRANSNLARALRVKDEFLANMSHELRTPLNAILGLSESLGEQVAGPLNEKQQKYLSTINESGHHLLSLINDILDLAKIEAGQITLDINKVDVNSVCQASLRMIKQLAQKKNQEVVFEMDNDLGLMWADERRLKQMIVNLLSNAVKFTPESGRIGLEVRGDRAANKVIITVSDTGIGIKEQDLERLFKPFVQLDSGLAREATGTGLGLALVAQMARLHGGSVHALSQPGDGSRFIIQLPWEPAMASDIVARLRSTGKFRAINPNADRLTILLIEDTREVVMMLVDYLEMAGYNILTAQDGIEGLEQAKLTKPDLILMDIQMPRMDGFETTQKLRSDPEFKDIPIIALTALAMPNDRQRCLDAGMDEYMSKPVNLKALTKTIHKLLFQNQKAGLS